MLLSQSHRILEVLQVARSIGYRIEVKQVGVRGEEGREKNGGERGYF